MLKTGPITSGCSGSYSDKFWVSLKMIFKNLALKNKRWFFTGPDLQGKNMFLLTQSSELNLANFCYFNHTLILSAMLNSLTDSDGWMSCLWYSQYFLFNEFKCLQLFCYNRLITNSNPIYHFLCMYIIFNTWSLKIDQKWEKWKEISSAKLLLQRHPSWQGIWTQNHNVT